MLSGSVISSGEGIESLTMPADNLLTRRELEVLEKIGQGKTSRQIAEILSLSVYTVNNHRKHICKKIGLHSTAQLVAYAVTRTKGA
jgi:two-component system nitrate/nitrite response regulator NarL